MSPIIKEYVYNIICLRIMKLLTLELDLHHLEEEIKNFSLFKKKMTNNLTLPRVS